MNGGPSQVDTWDYKPELARRDGQRLSGFDNNTGFFTAQVGPVMKSPFNFRRHGQSGAWASELFPNLATHADDMALGQSYMDLYLESHDPVRMAHVKTILDRLILRLK